MIWSWFGVRPCYQRCGRAVCCGGIVPSWPCIVYERGTEEHVKGPLCAHQCCPIGVGAHSGAHFCTDTHGGGALGDALGDRVMTLGALAGNISARATGPRAVVLFCSWQRSWQGAGGFERCRCHGCWGFSHARTALSRERAPPAKR